MRHYVKRYNEYVPFRLGTNLLHKIKEDMKANGIENISKEIRRLIEIGLSLPPPTLHNGGSLLEKADTLCPMTDKKLDPEQCKICERNAHDIWVKCHS